MAAFNNVKNICYLHLHQYYWQFSCSTKLSKIEMVLPAHQLYNMTYLRN